MNRTSSKGTPRPAVALGGPQFQGVDAGNVHDSSNSSHTMMHHRESSTSPGSRKAVESAADCLHHMSSSASHAREGVVAGWEESEHEGLLTMLDEKKKRWYRCKNENCDYINDRLYHSKMHYERIHIKNGVAMPRKRKYDTLPASVAEATYPSSHGSSATSDHHPAAKQARQMPKQLKQSPKTSKSAASAASTPRYFTPKQQGGAGKSSTSRTPENCRSAAGPSSGLCATKLFDMSPENNKIYTFGEGFSFSCTSGLCLNAADLVRPAVRSTSAVRGPITSSSAPKALSTPSKKASSTAATNAPLKDVFQSPDLSARECPPSPSQPLSLGTPRRTSVKHRSSSAARDFSAIPTSPPASYRQPLAGLPTSCGGSPLGSPARQGRSMLNAFVTTPVHLPRQMTCTTPRQADSPSMFLRTPWQAYAKREGRVLQPLHSLLCTEDMSGNDVSLGDMEELMDSSGSHGDVFSAWQGIAGITGGV